MKNFLAISLLSSFVCSVVVGQSATGQGNTSDVTNPNCNQLNVNAGDRNPMDGVVRPLAPRPAAGTSAASPR
jgi:hypothetical protein